jgi:hypothetical protein
MAKSRARTAADPEKEESKAKGADCRYGDPTSALSKKSGRAFARKKSPESGRFTERGKWQMTDQSIAHDLVSTLVRISKHNSDSEPRPAMKNRRSIRWLRIFSTRPAHMKQSSSALAV